MLPNTSFVMRLSSSMSLLACITGFLSLMTPVFYDTEGYALTWIDIQESPPLWIYVVVTFIVAAHDIKWFEGLKFIRKSDLRLFRLFLIFVAILMAFAMELAVNVRLTPHMFWEQTLFFKLPYRSSVMVQYDILYYSFQKAIIETVIFRASIGYHLMRLCRLILIFTFLFAILEKSPRKSRIRTEKIYRDYIEKTQQ